MKPPENCDQGEDQGKRHQWDLQQAMGLCRLRAAVGTKLKTGQRKATSKYRGHSNISEIGFDTRVVGE